MTEMKEPHFQVIDNNKQKSYERKKETTKIIQQLLTQYSKEELIEIIKKESL